MGEVEDEGSSPSGFRLIPSMGFISLAHVLVEKSIGECFSALHFSATPAITGEGAVSGL